MRIGILVTSPGKYEKKGFYNTQEMGLAKAMDPYFDEIKVYKLISDIPGNYLECIEGCNASSIQFVYAKKIGSSGIINVNILDHTLDVLIYFSDTQFAVPKVYRWAKKNGISFFPYIGVAESHSENKLIRKILDGLFVRNINIYKKCYCLAKTPNVEEKLKQLGIRRSIVAPVGLDISLLKSNYEKCKKDELKKVYGYKKDEKVLLFIARMVKEKEPERMVNIFAELVKRDKSYRLLMVGSGPLEAKVVKLAESRGIIDKIQWINRIPNRDIWKLYRMSDVYINLNPVEIFGMALLEAMYYECKVIAWKAPGPSYIVENGESGWLVESNEDAVKKIMDNKELGLKAHQRVISDFTWDKTADVIRKVISTV